jgi:hypothetical protein
MFNPLIVLLLPFMFIAYYFKWRSRRSKPWDGKSPLPEETHIWYKVPLEGCVCSEGSPYPGFIKRGRETGKLVFYFAGGGLSWNETTADSDHQWRKVFTGRLAFYNTKVGRYAETGLGGILQKDDPANPFNDWNFVYAPYATGDLHFGSGDFPYVDARGRNRVLHHHGARNTAALLKLAVETFPNTETILIAGESAGAFGAVANAPGIVHAFGGIKKAIIYSDASQLRFPGWKGILRDVWKSDPALVEAIPEGDGRLIKQIFEWAWKALGEKAIFLHSNTTCDGILCMVENIMNTGNRKTPPEAIEKFTAGLREDMAALAAEIPQYRYYLTDYHRNPKTGLTGHTFVRDDALYTKAPMEDGLTAAQWLDNAVNRGILVNAGERHLRA